MRQTRMARSFFTISASLRCQIPAVTPSWGQAMMGLKNLERTARTISHANLLKGWIRIIYPVEADRRSGLRRQLAGD